MSDFLTQLIARSLDQAPRLQRRQPALFEPRALDQQSLSEITVDQPAAMPTQAQPVPVPAARLAPVVERLPQVDPAKPASPPQPVLPQPGAPQRLTVPPAERLVERHTEHIHEASPAPERIIHHTTETRHEHTHTEVRQTVIEQHRFVERALPVPAAVQPRLDHTIIEQRPADSPKVPSQRSQEDSSARSLVVARPSPPLPRRPESIAAPTPPVAKPEPVISVSIGRVEIRAAQPAAAAPRAPRPSAPKLGLDEYLRRRTGGVQ